MKKFILISCVVILSALGMSYKNTHDHEWIPENAIEAADKYWISFNDNRDEETIKHQYGLSGRNDILHCELRHGYQIITINYDEYEKGVQ